jgi:hypothetical protein
MVELELVSPRRVELAVEEAQATGRIPEQVLTEGPVGLLVRRRRSAPPPQDLRPRPGDPAKTVDWEELRLEPAS